MIEKKYDVVIIGGGPAGLVAAKVAYGLGKRTLLIEKDKIGGECTWTGCVPSKTMIACANVFADQRKMSALGMPVQTKIDASFVLEHVRRTIQQVYATHTPEKLESLGIDLLKGAATFVDAHTVQVGERFIRADKIIIGTGSVPFIPDIPGLKDVPYLTNENFFDLSALPSSIIVLGAGPVGIEFASALNNLGVKVILVEAGDRILSREDAELSDLLLEVMRKRGVEIYLGARAVSVASKDGQVVVRVRSSEKELSVAAEQLLVAIGRRPSVEGLELSKAGVGYNAQGVVVDQTLRTAAKNIYAAGDCVGPYRFSHTAEYQASLAAQNACIPFYKRSIHYQPIWVTFCTPEFAHLGMTEEEARAACGDAVFVMRKNYATLDRGVTDDNTEGRVKLILHSSGHILGAHILGERAGELIHELAVIKESGIRFDKVYNIVHAYPTYSELIWQLSKQYYIERIKQNPFIRLIGYLRSFFGHAG